MHPAGAPPAALAEDLAAEDLDGGWLTVDDDTGARRLVAAIVLQAAKDWRAVQAGRRELSYWPEEAPTPRRELRRFWRSKFAEGLCDWLDLDPDRVRAALGLATGGR